MSTYILVLTLWGYSSNSGKAIVTVPGFKTVAECRAAGNAWLGSKPSTAQGDFSAICLEQKQ